MKQNEYKNMDAPSLPLLLCVPGDRILVIYPKNPQPRQKQDADFRYAQSVPNAFANVLKWTLIKYYNS